MANDWVKRYLPRWLQDALRTSARTTEEIGRQFDLWGQQNHPNISQGEDREPHFVKESVSGALLSTRNCIDEAIKYGTLGWDLILTEEVYEALAEALVNKNDKALVTELHQVAAVAESWIAAIERREAK